MHDSRIVAVDHVLLEVRRGLREELVWFYGEVAGLELRPGASGESFALRFRSGQLEIRILEVDDPRVDGVESRVTLLVNSLADVRAILDDARIDYERISPTVQTDRRVSLLDPAGHRVELKQYWPFAPL